MGLTQTKLVTDVKPRSGSFQHLKSATRVLSSRLIQVATDIQEEEQKTFSQQPSHALHNESSSADFKIKSRINQVQSQCINENNQWQDDSQLNLSASSSDHVELKHFVSETGAIQFRVLSYNIWFENITEKRIGALLRVLEDSDADVICLQEVTEVTREAIVSAPFIKQRYLKNGGNISGNSLRAFYGCLILSRYPSVFYEVDFWSYMGRSLLVCEPLVKDYPLVATAHFESLDSAKKRADQMKTAAEVLTQAQEKVRSDETESAPSAILVGDFNFDPSWKAEEQVLIDNGFTDVLPEFIEKKAFSMYKTPRFSAWRPDKITVKQAKGSSKQWVPISGQICGNFTTPEFPPDQDPSLFNKDGIVRTPSDHLAVVADFQFH